MTSGYGYQGGRSRCYNFWQDYFDCYCIPTCCGDARELTAVDQADHPQQCSHRLKDYMECLHHKKEKVRLEEIGREWARKEKAGQISREDLNIPFAKASGTAAVMRLGYIDQPSKKADSKK